MLRIKTNNNGDFYNVESPFSQPSTNNRPVWYKVGILSVFAYRHILETAYISCIGLVREAADSTYGIRPGLLETKLFVESIRDAAKDWTEDDWRHFIRLNVYVRKE